MPNERSKGGCFLLGFAFFWCSFVGVVDGACLVQMVRQVLALEHPTTPGTILKSEVIREDDGEGVSYHFKVEYRYSVNQQPYTGNRYRYFNSGSGKKFTTRLQKELPPGKDVPVYYNPDDPEDAILAPGIIGGDLFVIWFLTPFSIIGIALIYGVFWAYSNKPGFDPEHPNQVQQTADGWEVLLPSASKLGIFAVSLLAITFLGCFVIAFLIGFNPSIPFMLGAWAFALVLSSWIAARYVKYPKLSWNAANRTLTYDPDNRKDLPTTITYNTIQNIEAEEERYKDSDGDEQTKYHTRIVYTDPNPETKPLRLSHFTDKSDNESFAKWLNAELMDKK